MILSKRDAYSLFNWNLICFLNKAKNILYWRLNDILEVSLSFFISCLLWKLLMDKCSAMVLVFIGHWVCTCHVYLLIFSEITQIYITGFWIINFRNWLLRVPQILLLNYLGIVDCWHHLQTIRHLRHCNSCLR